MAESMLLTVLIFIPLTIGGIWGTDVAGPIILVIYSVFTVFCVVIISIATKNDTHECHDD